MSPIIYRRYSCDKLIGKIIPWKFQKEILNRGGLKIIDDKDLYIIVQPPSWRHDLVLEVNLIAEVLRFYGINNI